MIATNYKARKPGRKMINDDMLAYDKFGIKCSASTALSADRFEYKGNQIFGGLNIRTLLFWRKPWSTGFDPNTVETGAFELLVPYEYCVNSHTAGNDATTPKTKIGQNLFQFPDNWYVKANKARRLRASAPLDSAFVKVNHSTHTFVFTNYSRHPVQIFFEYGIGPTKDSLAQVQPTFDGTNFGGMNITPSELPDRYPNIESFIAPGTLDGGDMGAKSSKTIHFNWNKLFGEEYAKAPASADYQYPNNGPWLSINPDVLEDFADANACIDVDPGVDGSFFDGQTFHARLRIHAVLMEPHALVKSDGGVGSIENTKSTSLLSDTMNIEVYSQWDTTVDYAAGAAMERGNSYARISNVES